MCIAGGVEGSYGVRLCVVCRCFLVKDVEKGLGV